MAEQAEVVESKCAPEVQREAEGLGWKPAERWKPRYEGDRFIDADAYIERTETVLPIVKSQLAATRGELAAANARIAAQDTAIAEAQEAIQHIEARHTVDTQKAVEAARRQVKEQLAAASQAGDHEAVAELTEQMVDLNNAEKAAESKPVVVEEKKAPEIILTPEQLAWNAENPWFSTNTKRTALFIACCQELRAGGETARGKPFFDMAKAEMEKELGIYQKTPDSKVEGGRQSGDGESRQSGKKTYAALPADAKSACEADTRKFVGKGKLFQTAAEWHDHFANLYYQE